MKKIKKGVNMHIENINIKLLNEKAIVPTYGSTYSAGADLYACIDDTIKINPGETAFIGTGISFEIPTGFVGLVYARSSLGCKKGLAPSNKVGVIDSDYRGELIVALHNHSKAPHLINPNDRIAQIVFTPYLKGNFCIAESLDSTERGTGGFGSTDK